MELAGGKKDPTTAHCSPTFHLLTVACTHPSYAYSIHKCNRNARRKWRKRKRRRKRRRRRDRRYREVDTDKYVKWKIDKTIKKSSGDAQCRTAELIAIQLGKDMAEQSEPRV